MLRSTKEMLQYTVNRWTNAYDRSLSDMFDGTNDVFERRVKLLKEVLEADLGLWSDQF